jgi:hypothetical protein
LTDANKLRKVKEHGSGAHRGPSPVDWPGVSLLLAGPNLPQASLQKYMSQLGNGISVELFNTTA